MARQLFGKKLAHFSVKSAQEQVAAVDQGGIHTETVEDAGKFHCDISTADNHRALRQGIDIERLVGGYHMLLAGNVRDMGPAAGRHQDAFGADILAVDPDRVRSLDNGPAVVNVYIITFK